MRNTRRKSCPRCFGNIFLERAMDGWDVVCLNCGFRREYAIHQTAGQKQKTNFKESVATRT